VELFILPDLARHTTVMNIDSKKFLFFRNLKAELEMENGIVLVTENIADFDRIATHLGFDFVEPWPGPTK